MHHQVGCLLATNLQGADSFQSSVWGFFNSVPMFLLLCAWEKMLGTDGLNLHFGQPASLLRGVVVVSYLRTCDSGFVSSLFAYLSLHSALACAVCIGFFSPVCLWFPSCFILLGSYFFFVASQNRPARAKGEPYAMVVLVVLSIERARI